MPALTNEKTEIQNPQRQDYLEESPRYTVDVDIFETDDALILKADLPGVKAENLNIQMDKGRLSIEAKVLPRGPAAGKYQWREYGIGSYSRNFELNVPTNAAEIRATLKQGELTLVVPKAESARTRQIPVRTA